MPISGHIRHRLVTVILLGVVTSALSLVALVRVISLTTSQRIERGRAGVLVEVARLAETKSSETWQADQRVGLVGARSGFASPGPNAVANVPDDWRADVERTVAAAARAKDRVTVEIPTAKGILVISAQPATIAPVAWVGYLIPTPVWLRTWRIIVIALTIATGLLVTNAVAAVITVKRGAAALNTALDGLANDLSTVVPRPRLRELSDVADGIARLARNLERSRALQEDMVRELAMKDRLAALGRVVAGVAHEVRNPLASIKLRLDLAAGGPATLPAAANEAIAHASREIARLDRLVADLLVMASPGMGPRVSTDVAALVRARAESLMPWSAVRRVTITVTGAASAVVDVDALARAIDNLMRNAVEASPPDSVVEVSVRQTGDLASITVADRGPGVASERTQELFEPFFTTKPDGTGLGLAICRSIARAHDGDVSLTRSAGVTHVELTLSRAPRSSGSVIALVQAAAS